MTPAPYSWALVVGPYVDAVCAVALGVLGFLVLRAWARLGP